MASAGIYNTDLELAFSTRDGANNVWHKKSVCAPLVDVHRDEAKLHATEWVPICSPPESSHDIGDVRMDAVAADDEQEIATLDLPIERFGMSFQPVSVLGKAVSQFLGTHFVLKPRRIFDELANDLTLRFRVVQQLILDEDQTNRLIVFIYLGEQHVDALELRPV